MRFEVLSQDFVTRRQADTPTAIAAGSRCAVTNQGEILCSFMLQSKLGINDFQPVMARSKDGGLTWSEPEPLWPKWQNRYSVFGAVSRAPNGDIFYFGTRYPIDQPGEPFWSDATQGLKQNELFWAKSTNSGRRWTDPAIIPMPIPGSAEAPGAMCVTRSGHWHCCYAPYPTFDPKVKVARNQVLCLSSRDKGKSWEHSQMLRFESPDSGAAEAWVVELADGRLLGASWHMNIRDGSDHPNAYSLSSDGGRAWLSPRSTGIQGQSTGLAALPDGRALMVYNQRKHGEPGVWMALARPTESSFGLEANEIVWRAETRTQKGTSGEHTEWQDFSFGEPSVTVLPDQTLLVALWCIQPSGRGIYFVKLRVKS